MLKNNFLKKLSREENFYKTVDGAYDRMLTFNAIVAWMDFYYHSYGIFIFIIAMITLIQINVIIKSKYRIPRLGYAGFDETQITVTKKKLIALLAGIIAIILIEKLASYLFTHSPIWLRIVPLENGKEFFGSFFLVIFIIVIGCCMRIKTFYLYLLTFCSAFIIQYTFLSNTIFPKTYPLLAVMSGFFGLYKLIQFIRNYPVINQETE